MDEIEHYLFVVARNTERFELIAPMLIARCDSTDGLEPGWSELSVGDVFRIL